MILGWQSLGGVDWFKVFGVHFIRHGAGNPQKSPHPRESSLRDLCLFVRTGAGGLEWGLMNLYTFKVFGRTDHQYSISLYGVAVRSSAYFQVSFLKCIVDDFGGLVIVGVV